MNEAQRSYQFQHKQKEYMTLRKGKEGKTQ